MIKINLLPQELRKGKKAPSRFPYIPLAILGGTLFLLLTFFFYCDFLKGRSAYRIVQKEWAVLSPLMGQLKALENKIEIEMRGENDFLQKNVLNTDSMTRILSWVNEYLPSKGWLTELKAEREGEGCRLMLRGVVLPSRTQTGIEQIEEFLQKLKTKLPSQTAVVLTTSKEVKEKVSGTAFTANLEWGVPKKP
jgi:signal recognition particle subunit SEC65